MKLSEFRRACAEEFGEDYSRVLIRDHWVMGLEGTAQEALARGESTRRVWELLCEDLGVSRDRWHGRGLKEPPK